MPMMPMPRWSGGHVLRSLSVPCHTAIKLARNLNKVSDYKHKSWYIHLLVWVVARQLFKHGNTWRLSTAAIESRGARLKKKGRTCICWRRAIGETSYSYTDRQSGEVHSRTQQYRSSAVQQLLMKICGQERDWHTPSAFSRPEHLRLVQQLRTKKLKFDAPDLAPRESAASVLHSAAVATSDPETACQLPPKKAFSRDLWMFRGGQLVG